MLLATNVAHCIGTLIIAMSEKKVELSLEQKDLLEKTVNQRKSIFFTGCGGTGKSFVLGYIIKELRSKSDKAGTVAVTASTGKAAFNVGGTTLHSFAGIQLGNASKDDLYKKAHFNSNSRNRWKEVTTLIIDEISMIDGELFDKLEYIARRMKENNEPFGGIQLILVGDLLQLPPVQTLGQNKKRIFEADSWKKCIQEYIMLGRVFRQNNIDFIRVLTCIRVGEVTDEVVKYMEKLAQKKDFDEKAGVVNLYATKNKTDEYNNRELNKINANSVFYHARDIYTKRQTSNNTLLDSCQAPKTLELKIGAQVMLVRNITKDLVNGTVGIVTSFTNKVQGKESIAGTEFGTESFPVVKFNLANGRTFTRPMKRELWESVTSTGAVQGSRRQIPLILAWAITVHKSQSQTIQRLRVDASEIFESGQLYTALSRAVNPDTLEVTGFDPDRVKVDTISLEFCLSNNLI